MSALSLCPPLSARRLNCGGLWLPLIRALVCKYDRSARATYSAVEYGRQDLFVLRSVSCWSIRLKVVLHAAYAITSILRRQP